MNCQKFQESLYRYMDQELESGLCLTFKEHLESCPVCQLAFEKEKKFDRLLKGHMVREEAPFELREKIIAQLDQPGPLRKLWNFRWLSPASLSSGIAFILIVGALTVFSMINRPFPVFAASVDTHLDYLRGSYPLEIETNNMQEALEWFAGKCDFALEKPHLNLDKVNLVGARICHLKDKKAAYFIFEKDGHKISTFYTDLKDTQFPRIAKKNIIDGPRKTIMIKNEKGFHSVMCLHKIKGTGCIFVSDLPRETLLDLMI